MTSDATGWDAIDQALENLYPGIEPQHYATLLKFRLGGPDPLDGISFYPRTEPVPHWHAVTYGMSELYEKESENLEESGWGFEFTFRLRRDPEETEPPVWAANFLQNLARYVFDTGNWFEAGHHMDLNGPIALERATEIRAIAFAEDPELGTIDTPHGKVVFLQVVGITPDEYAATQSWSVTRMLELAAEHLPLLVTDLDRRSLTDDPAVAAAVEEGRRREGSATGSLAVAEFRWERSGDETRLVVGAHIAERVGQTLLGRLPFDRQLDLRGPDGAVLFRPGAAFEGTERENGWLELVLPAPVLDGLVEVLVPRAGARPVPGAPNLVVEIEVSRIRDEDGNVVQTVG
ncbi:suppressor of fused domain protein [Micromonospora sp. NPDC049559]|uniref:suppressor of fused domain protein n=1 Tax=Micromonospora sp. NPDC049559 TaxID=3155923 RepID=UPI003425C004